MNLFEKAIRRDELWKFALGSDDYFLHEPDWGTHWVLGSWLYHIVPFLQESPAGAMQVPRMLEALLHASVDPATKASCILYHLQVYAFLCRDRRLSLELVPKSSIRQLFDWLEEHARSLPEAGDAQAIRDEIARIRGIAPLDEGA